MARRSTTKTTTARRGSTTRRGRKSSSKILDTAAIERNFNDVKASVFQLSEKPAVRYIAAGAGLAILARLAMKAADKYPEISRFFQENLDVIEDKLREYRGGSGVSEDIEARH